MAVETESATTTYARNNQYEWQNHLGIQYNLPIPTDEPADGGFGSTSENPVITHAGELNVTSSKSADSWRQW